MIEKHGWGKLVEAGQFDQQKAMACLGELERKEQTLVMGWNVAMHSSQASLATFRKYMGDHKVNAMLILIISNFQDQLNVNRSLTDSQVMTITRLIMHKYYWINIADIKHFFTKVLMGDYGKIFDRIDVAVIMEWLKGYADERQNIAAEITRRGKVEGELPTKEQMAKWYREAKMQRRGKGEEKPKQGDLFKKKKADIERIKSDEVLMSQFKKEYDTSGATQPFEKWVEFRIASAMKHVR